MSTEPTASDAAPVAWLEVDGRRLAYRTSPGRGPHVLFCPGFKSDMEGSKALALEALCRARGQAFTRFDYSGHGLSSGRFEDGCIGEWAADAGAVFDQVTSGPVLLVGSSMGGWIMLLVARDRPARLAGLVGIAPAPDFTEDLIRTQATPEQMRAIYEDGVYHMPSPYSEESTPITRRLMEDGNERLVLRTPLPITAPAHLVHGQQDPDVPWQTSLRLAQHIASDQVTVELVKDAEHRLSRPEDIARIEAAVTRLSLEPSL